jgi:hypothetical protein
VSLADYNLPQLIVSASAFIRLFDIPGINQNTGDAPYVVLQVRRILP